MTDIDVPLTGSTLVVGPSGVGKTRLTARALETWVDRSGPEGVVVFEFAPAYAHEDGILGRRLDRFTDVLDDVWVGLVDAHAPRAESDSETDLLELARENANAASQRLRAAPPEPTAVFVDDVTIAFQHQSGDLEGLLEYCDRADVAVLNAFESDELGTDDPVSRRERVVLESLRDWADRTVALDST